MSGITTALITATHHYGTKAHLEWLLFHQAHADAFHNAVRGFPLQRMQAEYAAATHHSRMLGFLHLRRRIEAMLASCKHSNIMRKP